MMIGLKRSLFGIFGWSLFKATRRLRKCFCILGRESKLIDHSVLNTYAVFSLFSSLKSLSDKRSNPTAFPVAILSTSWCISLGSRGLRYGKGSAFSYTLYLGSICISLSLSISIPSTFDCSVIMLPSSSWILLTIEPSLFSYWLYLYTFLRNSKALCCSGENLCCSFSVSFSLQ